MSKLAVVVSCGMVVSSVFVAATASAETIAWYHFSEKADGEKATCEASAIIDSSARAKHGTVKSVRHTTEGSDATLAPTYRSSYGCKIYDPATGETRSNGTALDFAALGTSASQTGAVICVDSFMGTTPPAFGSVTVEALVCTASSGYYSTFAPIVGYWKSKTGCLDENWSLMMNPSGKIAVRYCGSMSGSSPEYTSGTHVINDGRWHHIALVRDASEKTAGGNYPVRVYVDGELDATYAFGTQWTVFTDSPLYIGGYTKREGRIFDGMIDEVRVSDTALSPDEMLKIVRDYPIDEDTMVYVKFDSLTGPWTASTVNLNCVATGPKMVLQRSNMVAEGDDGEIPYPEIVADVPAATLADGRFSTNRFENLVAARLLTTTKGNGSALYGAKGSYMSGSFTSEICFKSGTQSGSKWDLGQSLMRCGTTSMRLKLGQYLWFHHNNYDAATDKYVGSTYTIGKAHEFDDSTWHHIAVVYDRDAQTMRLYVDRRLRYAAENVDLEPTDYFFFVSNNPTGDATFFFDGWIDEFRHTKRALEPDEFLCAANDFKEESDVLLRASFEDDWTVTSGWQPLADAEPFNDEKGTVGFLSSESSRLAGDMVWTTNCVTGETSCRTNLYTAKLDRGYIGFRELPYYEGKDVTAETFVRITEASAQTCFFRYLYGDNPEYIGTPIFALYTTSATDGTQLSCRIGFTDQEFAPQSPNGTEWLTFKFGKSIYDGRWHHVALVAKTEAVEPTEENNNATEQTTIRVYVDRQEGLFTGSMKPGGYPKVGYHLPFKSVYSPRPRLSIGTGSTGAERQTSCVDEVRITTRALEPSEFLRTTRFPRGMTLILR